MPSTSRPVSPDHPRILGSRADLQALATARPEGFRRMAEVARAAVIPEFPGPSATWGKLICMALTAAVDDDAKLARETIDLAFAQAINKPILTGHSPHGFVTGICGIVYDLCHAAWRPAEREAFFAYMNQSWGANIDEETSPFHNAWYGYKNGGFGIACYATMFENPRAEEILRAIDRDYRERAVPCLKTAGEGGGFAEGFYTHYWLYNWLFFCEVARTCGGVDYYPTVPEFYSQRAIAAMFETTPNLQERATRGNFPMGDETAGRLCKRDRDQAWGARTILVNYYRDDPAHRAVHTYTAATPRAAFADNAYMDFLWRDATVPKGDLEKFKLSHYSAGPGSVYARSSWREDAACLYFRCGRRFTAHQHLDQGHLLVLRDDDLLGDGGHYEWNTNHSINYFIRTIAHSTMLVYDPDEDFPAYIRAGGQGFNDGGQKYPWIGTVFRHNGAAMDYSDWKAHPELHDTGRVLAFHDAGAYLYTAGDATRAYSAHKLEYFTRQVIFVRPGTIVVFDRVKAINPSFKKTCLWQAAKRPVYDGTHYVINNGTARLFMQVLSPAKPEVVLNYGPDLYQYHDHTVLPDNCEFRFRPEPECRMEISPSVPAAVDHFVHVLTVTDGLTHTVPAAALQDAADHVMVTVGRATIRFNKAEVGGRIELSGSKPVKAELANFA
jgi:hypothetical protein